MFAAKTYFDTCLRKVQFSVHMVTGHVIIATDHWVIRVKFELDEERTGNSQFFRLT